MTVNPPPSAPSLSARLTAEGFGSFLIVFVGIGTTLFTANLFADPGAGSAVYVAPRSPRSRPSRAGTSTPR